MRLRIAAFVTLLAVLAPPVPVSLAVVEWSCPESSAGSACGQATCGDASDRLERMIRETDPDLGQTNYTYDSRDNLMSVTDALSRTTTCVVDGFGDVIRETSPSGTTHYVRNELGLITSMTDARGFTVNLTFDDLGRLTSKAFPASSTTANARAVDDQLRRRDEVDFVHPLDADGRVLLGKCNTGLAGGEMLDETLRSCVTTGRILVIRTHVGR
jgi:YD repeat-containing protein